MPIFCTSPRYNSLAWKYRRHVGIGIKFPCVFEGWMKRNMSRSVGVIVFSFRLFEYVEIYLFEMLKFISSKACIPSAQWTIQLRDLGRNDFVSAWGRKVP